MNPELAFFKAILIDSVWPRKRKIRKPSRIKVGPIIFSLLPYTPHVALWSRLDLLFLRPLSYYYVKGIELRYIPYQFVNYVFNEALNQ